MENKQRQKQNRSNKNSLAESAGQDIMSKQKDQDNECNHCELETIDGSQQFLVSRSMIGSATSLLAPNSTKNLPKIHQPGVPDLCNNNQSLVSLFNEWRIPQMFRYEPSMITIVRHPRGFISPFPTDSVGGDISQSPRHSRGSHPSEVPSLGSLETSKPETADTIEILSSLPLPSFAELNDRTLFIAFYHQVKLQADRAIAILTQDNTEVKKELLKLRESFNQVMIQREELLEVVMTMKSNNSNLQQESGIKFKAQELKHKFDIASEKLEKEKLKSENLQKELVEVRKNAKSYKKEKSKITAGLEQKLKDEKQKNATTKEALEKANIKAEEEIKQLRDEKDTVIAQMEKLLAKKEAHLSEATRNLSLTTKELNELKLESKRAVVRAEETANQLEIEKNLTSCLKNTIEDLQCQLKLAQEESSNISDVFAGKQVAYEDQIKKLTSNVEQMNKQLQNDKAILEKNEAIKRAQQQKLEWSHIMISEKESDLIRLTEANRNLQQQKAEYEEVIRSMNAQYHREVQVLWTKISTLQNRLSAHSQQIAGMNAIINNNSFAPMESSGPLGSANGAISMGEVVRGAFEASQMLETSNSVSAAGEKVNECLQEIMTLINDPETTSSPSKQPITNNRDIQMNSL